MKQVDWKKAGSWAVFFLVIGFISYYGLYRMAGKCLVEFSAGGDYDFFFYFGMTVSFGMVFFMLFQAVCACFYKPVEQWESDAEQPGVTVIVPAYNEGSAVADTLRSLLKSDFPADKLEIIAINDGSKDDTWNWIKLVASESNGIITPVNFEQNQGKKAGLYYGFTHAKFDIAVTIDSDSIVEPDTLQNLILPFAKPEVGGVAGTVRVANLHEGFVPRMLDIFFVFSCDFMRCAQSTFGGVLCSPGAISAYRESALLPHLDGWLHHTFLGIPSHIGEDRALTSILLRNNFHVVLQHEAKVTTRVPTDYPQLCRTLIRWNRGDVREGLLMIKHFIKLMPCKKLRMNVLMFNLTFQLLNLTLPLIGAPMLAWMLIGNWSALSLAGSYILAVTWLWAIIPALLYAERESPLKALMAFVVGIFNLVALSWICAYSWITMRNSKWMTRNIKKQDENICPSPKRIS